MNAFSNQHHVKYNVMMYSSIGAEVCYSSYCYLDSSGRLDPLGLLLNI